MTSVWTTIWGMYDTPYAVPEGTVTDFPFLRSREDWRVCQVLRLLAVREIPPVVEEKPHFSWDYYPGSPPELGEMDRGVYVPGALGEWTIRASLHVLTLYEQREVRDVPVVRHKALFPTTPVWWEHVEVPRGLAARVLQMVALPGSQLMGEPLGGPYHLMLAALWAVEVADVFLGSFRHHGHLWRLPMAIRSAFADLTPERLCSADPSAQPLLETGLKLLRIIEVRAPPDRLPWLGGPRGVFRCAKALDDEGTLVLHEGLGDARLPYGWDIRADTRIPALDRDLADAASARAGLAVAPEPPSAPAASASAPLALLPPSWGRVSRPAYVSRLASRPARHRRAYPLGGSGGTIATLEGPPGPPLEPLPFFTWDGSAQFGTPYAVNPAIWSGLGRSLGELPSIVNNAVDHTLIMALSRTLVRLRNEIDTIGSRRLGERDVVPLYQLGTVETLCRYLTEEYGTAVVDTNTVVAGWTLRNFSASSAPPRVVALPAAPRRPPSPPPAPLWGGRWFFSRPLWGGRILDTTVKRTVAERQKKLVDHTNMQLTPQAAMGVTIKLMYGTEMEVATNPVFGNSRDTRINTTLGPILMMTHKRDTFFLWLLSLFSSGAVAPTTRKDGEAEAVEQATTARRRGRGRKRDRGSPKSKDPADGNEPPVSGWRNEGDGRAAVGGRLEETNVLGGHASVGRSGSGDSAAMGGSGESEAKVGGAVALVEHARARFLWSGGQVVGTADLHPEWTLFHSSPSPTGVVAGFLTSVSEGCGDMPYPFGQDEKLCLEKGYPSATPVPLRPVGSSKIAWPAGAIGYVAWPHSSVQVWAFFCALCILVRMRAGWKLSFVCSSNSQAALMQSYFLVHVSVLLSA